MATALLFGFPLTDLLTLIGALLAVLGIACAFRPRILHARRRSTGLLIALVGLVLVSFGQLQRMDAAPRPAPPPAAPR